MFRSIFYPIPQFLIGLTAPYPPRLLGLSAGIFFLMGFLTWLNGPLIAFVKIGFSLNDVGAFLVPMAFYIAYCAFSLPSYAIVHCIGAQRSLSLALMTGALGVAVFGQCVLEQFYAGALVGLFILGASLTLMQIVITPLVSLLGPPDRAAQRIAIMGICNKTAGILAPIVLAHLVFGSTGDNGPQAGLTDPSSQKTISASLIHALYIPYMSMAALLVLAALIVWHIAFPAIQSPPGARNDPRPVAPLSVRQLSAHRPSVHQLVGIIVLFLYVGVEVMAGDVIGTYGRAFGLPLQETSFFTSLTLSAMLAGYLIGAVVIPRCISQEGFLKLSCGIGIVLSALAFVLHGYASVTCVALLGAANAMIMPTIFPMALRRSGNTTFLASALLVMAYSGGAIIPQIYINLTWFLGFQGAFTILVLPIYAVILLYAYRYSHIEQA